MAIVPDQQQVEAVNLMLAPLAVRIVTGGPGTGKTTILRGYLQNVDKAHTVVLLAPTGRAARRVTEVTGVTAYTVHRWLAQGGGDALAYGSTIIIDEASMLDVETLSKLLSQVQHLWEITGSPSAVRLQREPPIRLCLMGDADQLPSVGPGNVLHDLIESGSVPVVRLKRVYRSEEGSWVANAAPLILNGDFDFTPDPGFEFIHTVRGEELVPALVEVALQTMKGAAPEKLPLVLVPQNVGPCGGAALNAALQARLNPEDGESFSAPGSKDIRHYIKAGDRVIATVNDYDRLVFNGETGVVLRVEGRGAGAVIVRFDYGDEHTYTKGEAAETLRLAYALTVHKAQGSEADVVVLVASMDHHYMLSRRLFYTAVTRARKKVIIVGQPEAVEHAVSNDQEANRRTTLKERIQRANRKEDLFDV
jgi:exodeoxyribonuclease V alpha subunit